MREAADQRGDYFFAGCSRAELVDGCYRFGQPARHDVPEVAQVCCVIQCKSMRSDPAADVNADGCDLLSLNPNAGAAQETLGLDAEFVQSVDNRLLHGPNIGDHVALPFSQIENGISDDLTGAMIGDVAAPIGGMKGNAGAAQDFFARQQIFGVPVAAERDDVRVLDDQELVGNELPLALLHQVLLYAEGFSIPHPPEITNFPGAHHM